MNDFIRFMLDIKDPNIEFTNYFSDTVNGKVSKIYEAKLHLGLDTCLECGSNEIIKFGYYTSQITFLTTDASHPVYIRLHKQRLRCKHCLKTIMAQSEDLVNKHCNIANIVKDKGLVSLEEDRSQKSISRDLNVSPSTISRVIDDSDLSFDKYEELPPNLAFDEFHGVGTDYHFIVINNDTSDIITILNDRKKQTISEYFEGIDLKKRQAVKTISIDLNSYYQDIARHLFPNALIVVDRFHICSMFTRAFNQIRASLLRSFCKVTREYRLLKYSWKLYLIPQNRLDSTNEYFDRHLRSVVTQSDRVSTGLDVNPILANSYDVMQDVLTALSTKDVDLLMDTIYSKKEVGGPMKIAIKSIKENILYVKNAIESPYSNGRIEGVNRMIKQIKRTAFGFRSFTHFKVRIILHQKFNHK